MANVNNIISFSFCTKLCTCGVMENVHLNTEIHCHFEYCIAILHITLQIEFRYTYASIHVDICLNALKHEWLMLICVNEQFKWPVSVYGINKMEKKKHAALQCCLSAMKKLS